MEVCGVNTIAAANIPIEIEEHPFVFEWLIHDAPT
jgi:hypothetical protein